MADIMSVLVLLGTNRLLASHHWTELSLMKIFGSAIHFSMLVLYSSKSLYKDDIEFKDVFLEYLLCEMPQDKSSRHDNDLIDGSR